MQLMWSLCKHSIIMSQIVANWALFNFLLFSDGTGLMKNNRKCEVDVPFLNAMYGVMYRKACN